MVPKPGRHVPNNSVGMFFRGNNGDEALGSDGRGAKKRPGMILSDFAPRELKKP